MNISLILLLPAMLLMGYCAGYTWRAIADPEPHHDFAAQVMMPAFADLLILIWLIVAWVSPNSLATL